MKIIFFFKFFVNFFDPFCSPTRQAATALSNNTHTTRLYQWLYNPYFDPFNSELPDCNNNLGACHSAELDYVFHSLAFYDNHTFHNQAESDLSFKALSVWGNFSHGLPISVDGSEWKTYDSQNRNSFAFSVPQVQLIQNYHLDKCNFWNQNENLMK